ncbi:twin-arginine translocase TatA/TatE family subunit [Atopobiaceae bacterium 24-176]
MFGIGDTEFVLIIIFAFLIFGPDKLPGMGRTIGRGLRQFRSAQDSVTKVVQSEVLDPMTKAATAGADGVKSKVIHDEDADIEAADLSSRSTETFAERKARLAVEKAARDEAAASEAPSATPEVPDATSVPKDDAAAAPEPCASAAEPAPVADSRSAAALYGLAPKEPNATDAASPEDRPAPEADATASGEEAGSRA